MFPYKYYNFKSTMQVKIGKIILYMSQIVSDGSETLFFYDLYPIPSSYHAIPFVAAPHKPLANSSVLRGRAASKTKRKLGLVYTPSEFRKKMALELNESNGDHRPVRRF